jgi:hypothetical protein
MQAGLNVHFSNFTPKIDPSLYEEEGGNYEVCLANISPAERSKRLRFAIIQFAIGFIILAVLLIVGADKLWRLPLYVVFASAGASYFQWRDKT